MQQLSADAAKLTIYHAFIEGDLDVPKHLALRVHNLCFNPQYKEFEPRTIWSLFKGLEPIPQFRALPSWESSLKESRQRSMTPAFATDSVLMDSLA